MQYIQSYGHLQTHINTQKSLKKLKKLQTDWADKCAHTACFIVCRL